MTAVLVPLDATYMIFTSLLWVRIMCMCCVYVLWVCIGGNPYVAWVHQVREGSERLGAVPVGGA